MYFPVMHNVGLAQLLLSIFYTQPLFSTLRKYCISKLTSARIQRPRKPRSSKAVKPLLDIKTAVFSTCKKYLKRYRSASLGLFFLQIHHLINVNYFVFSNIVFRFQCLRDKNLGIKFVFQ